MSILEGRPTCSACNGVGETSYGPGLGDNHLCGRCEGTGKEPEVYYALPNPYREGLRVGTCWGILLGAAISSLSCG